MRQPDHRRDIVLDAGQCGVEIVAPSPAIADARDPERSRRSVDSRGGVLDDTDPVPLECVAYSI